MTNDRGSKKGMETNESIAMLCTHEIIMNAFLLFFSLSLRENISA
jgi:hypothetical protein